MPRITPLLSESENRLILTKLLKAFESPRPTYGVCREIDRARPWAVEDMLRSLRAMGLITPLYRFGKGDVCVLNPDGVDAVIALIAESTAVVRENIRQTAQRIVELEDKAEAPPSSTSESPEAP